MGWGSSRRSPAADRMETPDISSVPHCRATSGCNVIHPRLRKTPKNISLSPTQRRETLGYFAIMGYSSQRVIGYARRKARSNLFLNLIASIAASAASARTRRRRSLPVPRRSWPTMDMRFMSGVDRHLPAQHASRPARATRECDASRSEGETTRGARTTRTGEDATRRLQCLRSTRQGLPVARQANRARAGESAPFTHSTLINVSERSRSSSNSSTQRGAAALQNRPGTIVNPNQSILYVL